MTAVHMETAVITVESQVNWVEALVWLKWLKVEVVLANLLNLRNKVAVRMEMVVVSVENQFGWVGVLICIECLKVMVVNQLDLKETAIVVANLLD